MLTRSAAILLRQVKSKNVAFQSARCMGGQIPTPQELSERLKKYHNHMDHVNLPSGDWKTEFKKKQVNANLYFIFANIFFLYTVYYSWMTGSWSSQTVFRIPPHLWDEGDDKQ